MNIVLRFISTGEEGIVSTQPWPMLYFFPVDTLALAGTGYLFPAYRKTPVQQAVQFARLPTRQHGKHGCSSFVARFRGKLVLSLLGKD